MGCVSRRSICLVGLFLLLALPGCELKSVTIRLSGLESQQVEGVRFWRQSERTGQFELAGRVAFVGVVERKGVEWLHYELLNPDGSAGFTLHAPVERDPSDPDMITVQLQYARWENPGWFKVSAYNPAGDSPLSDEQIFL